jgi:hypothetical protein
MVLSFDSLRVVALYGCEGKYFWISNLATGGHCSAIVNVFLFVLERGA